MIRLHVPFVVSDDELERGLRSWSTLLATPASASRGRGRRGRGAPQGLRHVEAVAGVDFEVGAGTFFTLLGPSGSGKTTTLRLIAGFERPDAGRIRLAGADITDLPPYTRDVNTVFQDYALFPHMTVAENVGYGLRVQGSGVASEAAASPRCSKRVRLSGLGDRKPIQLSGGQRQRVALARSIVNGRRCCSWTSRSARST